jgi:hypothetical protein
LPERVAGRAVLALQAGILLVLLTWVWSGLRSGSGPRIWLLVLIAAVPALLRLSPWRPRALAAAGALVALALLLALVSRASLWGLLGFHGDAWSRVGDVLPDGLRDIGDETLPLGPGSPAAAIALLDAALVCAAALCAWQVVARRRPLVGIAVVAVAIGYRWTVAPPDHPAVQGALALACALAVLALDPALGGRVAGRVSRPARGMVAGIVVVGVAAALGAGPARGGDGWWDWRTWGFSGSGGAPSYTLDLEQRYGQLFWPAKPVVVATVQSAQGLPLRAAVLEDFDGFAFEADPNAPEVPLRRSGSTLVVPGAAGASGAPVQQRITLDATGTRLLLAGGRPVSFTGPFGGGARLVGQTVQLDGTLPNGATYAVQTRVPDATPAELVRRRRYGAAADAARLRAAQTGPGGPTVTAPLWGRGTPPPPSAYGAYAPLAVQAARLAAGTTSPYAVVNQVETWLRRYGVYDEVPPYPPAGVPPLVDFVANTHRGFCQHFAGAMALMLRMRGIPARVAVGFTQGHLDADGKWQVVDRDAHSWVEVLLPGSGWLPFDPTPGRSAPNQASVSSPLYDATAAAQKAGIERTAVLPGPPSVKPEPSGDTGGAAVPGLRDGDGGGAPDWLWSLLAIPALLAVAPLARLVRRSRRRRRGDERRRVLGALSELESTLAELGHAPEPSSSPTERAEALARTLRVDAGALYARAREARYGPGPVRPGQAAQAWRESARARREARRRCSRRRRITAALMPPGRERDGRAAR